MSCELQNKPLPIEKRENLLKRYPNRDSVIKEGVRTQENRNYETPSKFLERIITNIILPHVTRAFQIKTAKSY